MARSPESGAWRWDRPCFCSGKGESPEWAPGTSGTDPGAFADGRSRSRCDQAERMATRLLLVATVLAAACAQQPKGRPGRAKLGFAAKTHSPASSALTLPALCADLTISPFSLDASGSPTSA